MSDTAQSGTGVPTQRAAAEPTGWVGMIAFGGIMMIMIGCFHAIAGLVGIFRDDYYLVSKNGLLLEMDYTAWGWTHLILGVVIAFAGYGVLVGQTWARVTGVILAMLSALANLAFLSAQPLWSTIIIALDVLVIYALVAHGRETRNL
jgi:hypothetical protein